MLWYIAPTVVCLLIKIIVLCLSINNKKVSRAFIGMICVITAHNLIEVLAFLQYVLINDASVMLLFKMYYVALLIMLASICYYILSAIEIQILKKVSILIFVLAFLIAILIIFSEHIVVDYREIGYSITAIKGNYYWVFQMYTLFTLATIMITMVSGCFFSRKPKSRVLSLYGLLSVIPIVVVGILVILFMEMGYKINAMGVLPVATAFFVLVTLKVELQHEITDIRLFIPYSLERKTLNEIQKIVAQFSMDEKDYKQMLTEIEKVCVLYKHKKMGENISKTAESLNIPRTTLYSMFRRLGICNPDRHKD